MKITITNIEPKVSKAKKIYWSINNKYTCHEPSITEKLAEGQTYNLDVQNSDDGKWHNIRGILPEGAEDINEIEVVKMNIPQETKGYKSPLAKKEMLLSYAKDLAICWTEQNEGKEMNLTSLMNKCVDVILQSYERISLNLDK